MNSLIKDFKLTPRELDCLVLNLYGYTAKQIAQKLSISYRTVEMYNTRIYAKFNINYKTELRGALDKHYANVDSKSYYQEILYSHYKSLNSN